MMKEILKNLLNFSSNSRQIMTGIYYISKWLTNSENWPKILKANRAVIFSFKIQMFLRGSILNIKERKGNWRQNPICQLVIRLRC